MSPAPGPIRTCIGCRRRAPREALLRLVVDDAGAVRLDPRRVARGRGASLHDDPGCFALALRRRSIGRALRVTGDLQLAPEVPAHFATPATDPGACV